MTSTDFWVCTFQTRSAKALAAPDHDEHERGVLIGHAAHERSPGVGNDPGAARNAQIVMPPVVLSFLPLLQIVCGRMHSHRRDMAEAGIATVELGDGDRGQPTPE
jgi:hypothetical protein